MRVMMKVSVPTERGNAAVQDGTLAKLMGQVVEQRQPEAAYFTVENGIRTAFFVFDLKDSTDMPAIGEPLFFGLNAGISVTPVMTAAELKQGLSRVS